MQAPSSHDRTEGSGNEHVERHLPPVGPRSVNVYRSNSCRLHHRVDLISRNRIRGSTVFSIPPVGHHALRAIPQPQPLLILTSHTRRANPHGALATAYLPGNAALPATAYLRRVHDLHCATHGKEKPQTRNLLAVIHPAGELLIPRKQGIGGALPDHVLEELGVRLK